MLQTSSIISARTAMALLACLLLAACSMAESTLLTESPKPAERCTSSAGSYYLSRSFLHVKVSFGDADKPEFAGVSVEPKADRARGYCLDFLASGTSNDTFVIQKDKDEQLLQKITSNADDQSEKIVKTIVDTAFTSIKAVAANSSNRSDAAVLALVSRQPFESSYDPFNVSQAALVNDALKDLGYCLILDGGQDQTMGRRKDSYCDQPLHKQRRESALDQSASYGGEGQIVKDNRGLLYRPRLPYSLYLYRNERAGQKLPGKWLLWQTQTVFLENNSPILGIGIDRTFFAQRKTTLLFNMGVLQEVLISKDSELAGAVSIPLYVAQEIAALPSQIVQIKVNTSNRRASLIAAQDALIAEQQTTLKDSNLLRDERTKASATALAATAIPVRPPSPVGQPDKPDAVTPPQPAAQSVGGNAPPTTAPASTQPTVLAPTPSSTPAAADSCAAKIQACVVKSGGASTASCAAFVNCSPN